MPPPASDRATAPGAEMVPVTLRVWLLATVQVWLAGRFNGTPTVAATINGPDARVKSATDGGFAPGMTGAKVNTVTMKATTLMIAHTQLPSTTASSPARQPGDNSPAAPTSACNPALTARGVSGAASVTSATSAMTAAITP